MYRLVREEGSPCGWRWFGRESVGVEFACGIHSHWGNESILHGDEEDDDDNDDDVVSVTPAAWKWRSSIILLSCAFKSCYPPRAVQWQSVTAKGAFRVYHSDTSLLSFSMPPLSLSLLPTWQLWQCDIFLHWALRWIEFSDEHSYETMATSATEIISNWPLQDVQF